VGHFDGSRGDGIIALRFVGRFFFEEISFATPSDRLIAAVPRARI